MNCKCNKLYIGLLIGLILPLITTYLIFYFRFGDTLTLMEFVNGMIQIQGFTKLLSISVIPNLLFFLMAIKMERLLAARGIVTATLLYAIVVIILRFTI
ncbi:hypothetical protein [Labilibacter marinus]|uniref:hypothetical protein n=1 Tax=Labilibacter marinus TaxID=1477105 RepID=UPI0008318ADC|nr:hypothetical protein [Labilibacter marinus]